jgi:hypothetical protein
VSEHKARAPCVAAGILVKTRPQTRDGIRPGRISMAVARIYKPARTAMQSGTAKTKEWVLEFEPEQSREVEPLMGWTSSGDMRQQVRLQFDSAEEAVAYCERHGIAYQVMEPKAPAHRTISYSDNFAFKRREAWTH